MMFSHDDPSQKLDLDECRRLLGTEILGRVAASIGALPVVVPVLYRLVGDRVVFGVGSNASLYAALAGNVVAFEVDHVDLGTHEGWTVLVVGRSYDFASTLTEGSPRLASVGSERLIGINLDRLTGLRAPQPVEVIADLFSNRAR